jgi:hypothetical protein
MLHSTAKYAIFFLQIDTAQQNKTQGGGQTTAAHTYNNDKLTKHDSQLLCTFWVKDIKADVLSGSIQERKSANRAHLRKPEWHKSDVISTQHGAEQYLLYPSIEVCFKSLYFLPNCFRTHGAYMRRNARVSHQGLRLGFMLRGAGVAFLMR